MIMKCPKCQNQVFLTAFTNDNEGKSITSFYRCEYCKIQISEEEIIENSSDNNIEVDLEY